MFSIACSILPKQLINTSIEIFAIKKTSLGDDVSLALGLIIWFFTITIKAVSNVYKKYFKPRKNQIIGKNDNTIGRKYIQKI